MWEKGRYALVLTDCNMPEMDGYDLARSIRGLEPSGTVRRCPIIACTANAMGEEAAICLEAGMDDYLAKPVELKSLLTKLERWLPLKRAAVEAHPPALTRIQAAATSAICPIDHTILAKMTSGDAAMEREIFREFQRANGEDTHRLMQAVTDRDSALVKSMAHLIKGAGAMVGATHLSGICEHIEHANKGGDWSTVITCLTEFKQEVASLNQYFERSGQLSKSPA